MPRRGKDVTAHPVETKQHIAYIPEQVMLYRNLTGVENLEYFTALAGKDGYTKAELIGFLQDAGLARDAAARRVGTYSKGMRQKVGIAMAVAKNADALLLDEPTSGLDPKAANEFSQLLVPRFRFEAPGVLGAAPPATAYLLVLIVVLSLGLRRQLRRFDRRVSCRSPRTRRSRRLAAAPALALGRSSDPRTAR